MRILLAIDDSPHSRTATEAIARRACPPGSTVRILSVYPEPIPIGTEVIFAGAAYMAPLPDMEKHVQDVVAKAAETIKAAGFTIETVTRRGDARAVIVDEAKEWNADLIVVGSHGYTGIRRLLLGSVAQYVVSHAPCSVEVVRQKGLSA